MYPKYTGKCPTPEMEVVAEKWISEKKGHMVVRTLAFKIKDAQIYPLLIFDEKFLNYFIIFILLWGLHSERMHK